MAARNRLRARIRRTGSLIVDVLGNGASSWLLLGLLSARWCLETGCARRKPKQKGTAGERWRQREGGEENKSVIAKGREQVAGDKRRPERERKREEEEKDSRESNEQMEGCWRRQVSTYQIQGMASLFLRRYSVPHNTCYVACCTSKCKSHWFGRQRERAPGEPCPRFE